MTDEPEATDEAAAGPHPMDLGTQVDEVFVEIDYAILQHFSKHLYSSPNKAIEELVTNGYDALANRVDVFLPGTWAEDCLIVWDDGNSMDSEDLKHLWWIARSPKEMVGGDRIAVSTDGKISRQMVGKFGIGKLASYAVGDRLAHLCRRGDDYLLVSVDYQDAPPLSDDPDRERGFKTPIQRLDADTAKTFVKSLLRQEPSNLDELLARESWTIAVVDTLRPEVSLTEGRLRWVLGNGMPLRPDFSVFVNAKAVAPSSLKSALSDWNFQTPEVQKALNAAWSDAARTDAQYAFAPEEPEESSATPDGGETPSADAPKSTKKADQADEANGKSPDGESSTAKTGAVTTLTFGAGGGDSVVGGESDPSDAELEKAKDAWVELPNLGKVRMRLRLFATSLREGRVANEGRSEGFFIYVKGRLINPDDAKLLLPDPSFGTFNRMQVVLWADGLDEDLLADRERLQRNSTTAGPLMLLQQTLYLAGRARLDKHDDDEDQKAAPITALPSGSREFFRQPLTALALRKQADGEPMLNLRELKVESGPASEADPLMSVDSEQNALNLNTSHPLYAAVRQRVGSSKKGREALRLVELMALSDLLLEGHMLDLGLSEEVVDQVVSWRGSQLRGLAVRYAKDPEQTVSEVYDASYPGKTRFETALAQLFRLMGFVTDRDGAKGKKDILVVAPLGEEEFKFTIEAKGSKGSVENDSAEISAASAHAKAVNARFALVVAREFKGFVKPGESEAAVLQECRTQVPPVSIVTVETLHALYDALHTNHYPLPSLVPVLQEIESPADKLKNVEALRRPTAKFDVRNLLDRCWELQQGENSGLPVSVLTLRTARADWKSMSREEFDRIIFAIDALSGGLLSFHTDSYAVTLQQSPEIVADAIDTAVAPVSAETEDTGDDEAQADGDK